MNKTQITLAAVGGVVAVGALVLGYLIWDASSAKAEQSEKLESAVSSASGVMKKLPVKPVKAELAVYENNRASYETWRTDAEKIASGGDLFFANVTPAEFKTMIVDEARKIADRPGCFDGKFVKPDFGFGFKDYVTGGAMPPEKDLKRLQREWNDVSSVLKTIAECGGVNAGVVEVRMGAAKAKAEETAQPKKKGKKAKKAKVVESEEPKQSVTAFAVDFMMRPSGLVKALNAFATTNRFVVVESCTFAREHDEIAEKLGGDSSKKAELQSSSRSGRRRRGQQVKQQDAQDEKKGGDITDPSTAPYLKVTMQFSVYDFGSLETEEKPEKTTEEGEGK